MKTRFYAVLLALCLVAGSMFAQSNAGMRAGVDEKGQLRQPTAEELQQLEAFSKQFATHPVTIKVDATGRMSITLDESFDHAYIAMTDETGAIVFSCLDSAPEANALVAKSSGADTILRIRPMEKRTKAERE